MSVDAVACEPQFLDHLAPLWRELEPPARGRLRVDGALLERAARLGLEAEPLDAVAIRSTARDPGPKPGAGPQALVASIGDTKVARRLGYRRFAVIEHGVGQAYGGEGRGMAARHPSYSGGLERGDTELALVPNEYAAALWRAGYPELDVRVVGSPRLETLPAREPGGPTPTVALSFHWPAFVAPEAGTALGHYLPALAPLARAYSVLGHGHPKGDWQVRLQRFYRRAQITRWSSDFDEVCRLADVYVCDNSSTLFEFAATGRPVVVLNSPAFRRTVHHGLRFWEAASVGVQVDEPDELVAAVARALEDGPAEQAAREAALELVYARRTGAAALAAAAVSQWATSGALAVA